MQLSVSSCTNALLTGGTLDDGPFEVCLSPLINSRTHCDALWCTAMALLSLRSFLTTALLAGLYAPLCHAVTTVSVSATASHAIPTTLCE